MGKPTGFMEFERQAEANLPVAERVKNYQEFVLHLSDDQAKTQGARCMDCGIPFCTSGCPINNIIPDWNDLVFRGDWQNALNVLHSTNNFPEFTGRVCPAPCESACTLNINNDAVGIKSIEHAIIDKGWENGWVVPHVAAQKTGKKIAIVGSGPAGLASAQQLARAGHDVTVFEKNSRIGGLMRYGIPDFKMEKFHIDRRVAQMEAEGVTFVTSVFIGTDSDIGVNNMATQTISPAQLQADFDAVILAGGAETPRDLPVTGRELSGIYPAMDFLPQQNRVNAGDVLPEQIKATGKHVVVIGGGDTGSDCVGTSNRHGAASITQFEVMPRPPEQENKSLVWPNWPLKMRTSSSHEEGANRDWSVSTKAFLGSNGKVEKLLCVRVEFKDGKMVEVAGSEFEIKADLVLFAMGFVSPVQKILDAFSVGKDPRGNIKATTEGARAYYTSKAKVFAAGDMRRGQSLIVWAIREGRQCARAVDEFLMGSSLLPR
jgi:glutamate synthase (NADPH) small chain